MAKQATMTMDSMTKMLEDWFSKLPPLPKNVKDVVVKIAPILALVFGILGVLASLSATGLMAAFAPFMMMFGGFGIATGGLIAAVLGVVTSALMIVAYPGLKAHKMAGWTWLFYSQALSVVASVIGLNLVGAALGALIGFYLLFQVKSYYR